MYTQFFGLTEKPFSITPDPRYLYMSQRHADALAHLLYGISESGGFIQLTGEVGTGKTTLVRSVFEQLPDEADVALILNPELTTEEFLTAISEELGIKLPKNVSLKALIDGLNAYLLKAHGRGRRTVLIVDEAQNLGSELLEQVRLLTNLETPKQKLLQIILIGQPELREILSREDMRQVAQRVTGRYHLEPLSAADTARYVEHRMRVAGASGSVFRSSAVREIYRRSKGVPRLINVVADRALLAGYTQETRRINRRLVHHSAAEVFGEHRGRAWRRRLTTAAAAAAIASVAALAALWLTPEGEVTEQILPDLSAPAASRLESAASQVPAASLESATSLESAASLESPSSPDHAATVVEARAILPVEEPKSGPDNTLSLADLLADPTVPKDTASAFVTLFSLWGKAYDPAGEAACLQAEAQNLRCWFQRGSITFLRHLDRPAILSLTGDDGDEFQVVLESLDADSAHLGFGGQTYRTSLADVSRYWYGDSLILWQPGAGSGDDLSPGTGSEGVVWLRMSLARIENLPGLELGSESAFFDSELEARVRNYQRQRRLSVDGIAGAQTQIAINTDLQVPGTPMLSRVE